MGTAGQSITLANSIIGVGILAMPFCFQQCGVLLATLILLSMGLVSRLCCYFLLKSALLARRRNFEFLAFHVFGPAGKFAVEVGIIGFLMGTCIAYFVVVGDLGPQIIAKLFNINQSDILRTSIMVLVSLLCVLPLGLLRNVDSLSNVSAATIGFYFCLVLKVIAEAIAQLWTSDWQVHVELWKPAGVLQCVPIFSMALFCQTQLFEIFESLPTLSLEKMNLVTKNAINICTAMYFTLGLSGYIAFCSQQISGNILMSLSPTMGSDVIKLGFVLSVAFSFPLIIFPCRASLYSLLYKKVHSHSHHDHIINQSIPESSFRCITVAIVTSSLGVSLLLPNIELVLGLVGSTIGVIVCVVFPAACFVNVTFKNTNERVLAKGVLVLGLIIMVLGTYANLQAAESQIDKYDERYITPEKIDKMVEEFFEKMDKPNDGIVMQPIDKNDVKVDDNIIKDSKALPPNPVPPEMIDNPVKDEPKLEKIKDFDEIPINKGSVTHPKNLKKYDDIKSRNGDSNKIYEANHDINNVNKPAEEKQMNEEKKVNEEKKEMEKKQQQLIETIKQHGEEQKELLKEQKVILDEIKKTKKEMAQKSEADKNIEAKKIAVESIKKIADMAIQSLAGVSEKPVEDKKADDIGKLADEAVQEIAKKAVETIEAIKEMNEEVEDKPEEKAPIPSQNFLQPEQNLQQAALNVLKNLQARELNVPVVQNQPLNILKPAQNLQPNPNSQQSVQNVQSNQNSQQQNVNQLPANAQMTANNAKPEVQNLQGQIAPHLHDQAQQPVINNQHQIIEKPAQSVIQQPVQNDEPKLQPVVQNIPQAIQNVLQVNQNGQPLQNVQQQSNINAQMPSQNIPVQNQAPNVQQNIANVAQFVSNNLPNKVQNGNSAQNGQEVKHVHSLDEPKSYREGEDAQIPVGANINNIQPQNNENSKVGYSKVNEAENGIKDNAIPVPRQKREVVDCTQKFALKPEDKEICERLVNIQESDKIDLPKVDLNDGLSRSLPLDANVIHIGRSLKSYDSDENR